MTSMLDADGAAFSTMCCFRCEQAGPHWSSRHGRAGTFACRRCFATFSDDEPAARDGRFESSGTALPDGGSTPESK
ncbi:hypothetical protein HP499_06280 [Paenarthrobacter sp. CM16]|uniref:hypothetical protein n=1 Tax=Paenarthrobacter sp. CM16 TaxID=2738447 RepID=UPI0015520DA6|nr:hypothetical protein [Paenarthrobacter sp. CM16]NQD87415.1 hypothetical protein [Paenarthrobacter sp. CM16]